MPTTKLILGCGYLGRRVAQHWLAAGDTVHALTRSAERAAELARAGIQPIVGDVANPASLANKLPRADTILYAIGYDASAGATRDQVQLAGLKAALDAVPTGGATKIVFIGTTGVYGQTTGEWVDEDTPCEPVRDAGRIALAAEQLLAGHALGARAIILRLAGIYGPDRIPYMRDLIAGRAIVADPDGYLNLIHVDDATRVILAAEQRGQPPKIFLVSDGRPLTRMEYATELARQLGAAAPHFERAAPSHLAASRGGSDKRISGARMRAELNPRLDEREYPERLAELLAGMHAAS